MNDWMPELKISNNHELSSEISVIELSRSMMLYILHELILKYGQDLKNEQWALEPLADIIINLSVMQMGFTRYNQLDVGAHKDNTGIVLKYSIYKNFNSLISNVKQLIPYICNQSDLCKTMEMIDNKLNSLNYHPNPIELKKSICFELYKNGNYYLD